jgi:hypothetical protein
LSLCLLAQALLSLCLFEQGLLAHCLLPLLFSFACAPRSISFRGRQRLGFELSLLRRIVSRRWRGRLFHSSRFRRASRGAACCGSRLRRVGRDVLRRLGDRKGRDLRVRLGYDRRWRGRFRRDNARRLGARSARRRLGYRRRFGRRMSYGCAESSPISGRQSCRGGPRRHDFLSTCWRRAGLRGLRWHSY